LIGGTRAPDSAHDDNIDGCLAQKRTAASKSAALAGIAGFDCRACRRSLIAGTCWRSENGERKASWSFG
jgi:hypothetical protein